MCTACLILTGCGCSKEEEYTVKFDTDGGSVIESVKVTKGETVKRPDNPTKEGYVFSDWYLSDSIFDFNTKIENDITLKAKWIVNTSKCSIKCTGDKVLDEDTCKCVSKSELKGKYIVTIYIF